MLQIIQERRNPTKMQKFSEALGVGLKGAEDLYRQYQQSDALKGQGIDPNLSPEMQRLMMEYKLKGGLEGSKGQNKLNYLQQKNQYDQDLFNQENELKNKENNSKKEEERRKNLSPLEVGLETIDEMRKLRKTDKLGRGSSLFALAGGDTAKTRGEYERLGKSLIQLSTNIPIRNKIEFETLAHDLYDPSIPDSEAAGILDAMEKIIRGNMRQFQGNDQNFMNTQSNSQQNSRPPLSSFRR